MPKVTELYAWVVADKDENDEGVPAIQIGDNVYPLMGADLENVESMRRAVQQVADEQGKPVKLIKSSAIEVVEVMQPSRPKVNCGIAAHCKCMNPDCPNHHYADDVQPEWRQKK